MACCTYPQITRAREELWTMLNQSFPTSQRLWQSLTWNARMVSKKHHSLKYLIQHSFAHPLYVAAMSNLSFGVLSRNRKCCIFRRSLKALPLPLHRWKERQRGGKWLTVFLMNQVKMSDFCTYKCWSTSVHDLCFQRSYFMWILPTIPG